MVGGQERGLRRCATAYVSTPGPLSFTLGPEEGRSERTPRLPEIVLGIICQHLNANLVRTGREVLVYPLADLALRSPGHQPLGKPLTAITREVFLSEALAEPAVAVVR